MKLARMLAVAVCLLGWLTIFGTPRAFACDPNMGCDSSGTSSGGSSSSSGSKSSGTGHGCPPGGCVNIVTPEDTSGSNSSTSPSHAKKPKSQPPEVEVIPAQPPERRPPVHAAPVVPAPPVGPGGDFVPAAPATPVLAPILEQNAISQGAGAPDPAAGAEPPVNGSDGTSLPWALLIPSLATAAAGAVMILIKPRQVAPPVPPLFAPPVAASSDFSGWDSVHVWHIWTDNRGNFTLAEQPSGDFFTVADGPFSTFATGAAAMARLGIPGWS